MSKQNFPVAGVGTAAFIRLAVGSIFLSEGIQKFLYPDQLGVGRFKQIGLPMPGTLADFVAFVEISCGILIMIGLMTRLVSIPLIIDMSFAIILTKIPIFFESGFWAMVHEARTDYAMLLGSFFLLFTGAGAWSLDRYMAGSKIHVVRVGRHSSGTRMNRMD